MFDLDLISQLVYSVQHNVSLKNLGKIDVFIEQEGYFQFVVVNQENGSKWIMTVCRIPVIKGLHKSDYALYRTKKLQEYARKLKENDKYDAEKYVVIEFKSSLGLPHSEIELGENCIHFTEDHFVEAIYQHSDYREHLRYLWMKSIVKSNTINRSLVEYLVGQLNKIPCGNGKSEEKLDSRAYQELVKKMLDFAFEDTGIPPGKLEQKLHSNDRLDVVYNLSRCVDTPFNEIYLKRFSANFLMVECKNSEKYEEVKKGVNQVSNYITGKTGGAIGIVCVRKMPPEAQQRTKIKQLQKGNLTDEKPILVLCDDSLQELLKSKLNPLRSITFNSQQADQYDKVILENRMGCIAWLQHSYDALDL